VVATISDVDCCNTCAATDGCGAWTMTPPSDCADRVTATNLVGCCFLKASWRCLPCQWRARHMHKPGMHAQHASQA
jgi:hypothetical protein